ncbi:hypothetical protein B4102_2186 [Heyndrickxia sporothermodurans]|uniref:Helicase n=2 Tax=Heyndrickxia sporothermodurans TaxID=46224 RepID=A0A150LGJ3_9BACI|nr:hypothetical protein B4102_2186 [Heyndrickxia sporothermodurans]
MLATKNIWKKVNREIVPSSKAIMVTKYEEGQQIIDYLFDITQTKGSNIERPMWSIQPFEREYISNRLSIDEVNTLEEKMDIFTKNVVLQMYLNAEDHCEKAFDEYSEIAKNSYLKSFFNLLVSSAQFSVREKSGLDHAQSTDFSFLKEIRDVPKLNILGYLISSSTKAVMSEIAKIKKQYSIERDGKNEHIISNERGRESISEHRSEQQSRIGSTIRNIWKTGHDIFARKEPDSVLGASDGRNIDGKNAPSRFGSERKDSESNGGNEENQSSNENRGHNGENKSSKLIKVPGGRNSLERIRTTNEINENKDKQEEPDSNIETGSSVFSSGDDIQLELFNDWDSVGVEVEEKTEIVANPSSITQKDIDFVLLRGTGFENGKFRVIDFYATNPSDKESVKFLKSEYGIGGWGYKGFNVSHDSKGITIRKGEILNPEKESTIKWLDVSNRLKGLINLDRYLSSEEKLKMETYRQKQEKKSDGYQIERTIETNESTIETDPSQKDEIKNLLSIQNYRYDVSHNLYSGGDKTKYKNNVAAIRLLKQLESNKEIASAEQQKILARYVGWGGLANAFNPDSDKWEKEYKELKALLTEREYREAMESTITAYYTEPAIIEKIYKALQNFGFKSGNILDPAMGTGNFFSVLPQEMTDSKLFGVEIDSITGRIAKQLYPEANVQVQGYETTKFKDNQFDVVLGNIPFNNISIHDERYDTPKFLIHDYFIAKSLDVVKPGGIIAVITSRGTMDKKSSTTREYIAKRSELLGAIRLPNTAFKSIAGTEVTTDILFLKKRDSPLDSIPQGPERPDWMDIEPIEGRIGIEINRYFKNNPDMILGTMEYANFYGGTSEYKCVPKQDQELLPALDIAVNSIEGTFSAKQDEEKVVENTIINKEIESEEIMDSQGIKNFTYVVKNQRLYYCENDLLIPQKLPKTQTERIKGLCEIRIALQDVINIQSAPYEENDLKELQIILNDKYDKFVQKYGYINDRANQRAFYQDDQLPLLLSIEDEENDKTFKKAAIFNKATIRPQVTKNKAETAQEALEMSLNKNMKVDLAYMSKVYSKEPEIIIEELGDRIYLNPEKYTEDITVGWEVSDEYLTGNVHDKLEYAKMMAKQNPEIFTRNILALEDVQPARLLPGDINYKIGSPWIPKEYYKQFMYELFETSNFNKTSKYGIRLEHSTITNVWKVEGKDREYNSVKVNSVFGTKRRNAYQIFEDCLNLQDSTVRDQEKYYDINGNEQTRYVINPKETMIARSKQHEIQSSFNRWLFSEPKRSEHLLQIYNEKFNTIRPRSYNGEHLTFPDMNKERQLRTHQKNAVARILSTGRALLAHEVGAGKTAAMIAGAMKLKQIGAIKKPMFVVMNHTIDQWASEFLRFYPGANVLITTKKDFEKQNRQKFVSKIATGNYDAVIIGHSQFEKIPISKERQENNLRKEINTLTYEIQEAKKQEGNDWSVKQLVIFQKSLENRLKKLAAESKKDNVINFEDLGVDCLFVDEAHVYKNLFTLTKLRNVAGIGTSSSQRASDMKMKCEYIQEQNQGRGVIFATATPVTNSMSELFVMQRFLQPEALNRAGLEFFDNWAGTFGEVVSSLEMTPEGSGYRMKSRFSKFHNLPELMNMFNMVGDIQTAEMLNLPVPELDGGKAKIIVSECSDFQKNMMDEFVVRSEDIRNGSVDPSIDNMLKLTHEAKLMAIDPRLIDENAPINENSKLNICVRNVFNIWEDTKDKKSTQMIFCDSGTPKPNKFNVYDEIKSKLIEKGIPAEEIAFIHDAKTDMQRDKLFSKVRKGEVRVLLGSTSKVGTGTNVQDKLIAGHHIDCPWRPADLTQRDGRIIRQGNENSKVSIYRYVTKGTFDSYLWQIQEQKLRYISQVMTGKNISRSCNDTDETVLTAAEVKAIATDNPLLLEKMTLDNEVDRLNLIKNRWINERTTMERNLAITYPNRIKECEEQIQKINSDISIVQDNQTEGLSIELKGITYVDEKEAEQALKSIINTETLGENEIMIGKYRGLDIFIRKNVFDELCIGIEGKSKFDLKIGERLNIQKLERIVDQYKDKIVESKDYIDQVKSQIKTVELELKKPFRYENELQELLKKQSELNLKMEFKGQIVEDNNDKSTDSELKDSVITESYPEGNKFKKNSTDIVLDF